LEVGNLDFSWEPFERDTLRELEERTKKCASYIDIDQLESPFDCLDFLRLKGIVSKEFLCALANWSYSAVFRRPTRSHLRPLGDQLSKLHDIMREWNLEANSDLHKAIRAYVQNKGTAPKDSYKPLRFKRGRGYAFRPDPLENKIPKDGQLPSPPVP